MGKKRVIIVEDDLVMVMEMREFLEGPEYEVQAAASTGEDALKEVRSREPDLVLMDVRLKGRMDGLEAARRIRDFSRVPIIFLTGYKNSTTAQQAAAVENSFFITKPFDPAFLMRTIEKAANPS